jgi:hypothetical protein
MGGGEGTEWKPVQIDGTVVDRSTVQISGNIVFEEYYNLNNPVGIIVLNQEYVEIPLTFNDIRGDMSFFYPLSSIGQGKIKIINSGTQKQLRDYTNEHRCV